MTPRKLLAERHSKLLISTLLTCSLVGQLLPNASAQDCEPGTAATDGGPCTECEAGRFSDGSADCDACPPGQFASEPAATSCTTCPAGAQTTGGSCAGQVPRITRVKRDDKKAIKALVTDDDSQHGRCRTPEDDGCYSIGTMDLGAQLDQDWTALVESLPPFMVGLDFIRPDEKDASVNCEASFEDGSDMLHTCTTQCEPGSELWTAANSWLCFDLDVPGTIYALLESTAVEIAGIC